MPKIPTAEEQVRFNPPTAQEYKIPGAVPGAFGEDIAKAEEGFGQDMAAIGEMANKHNKQLGQVKLAELKTNLDTDVMNIEHNDQTYTFKDPKTGQMITKNAGTLDNYGTNAIGETNRFMSLATGVAAKYADEFQGSPMLQAELKQYTAQYLQSRREQHITHETTQTRIAANNVYEARLSDNILKSGADPNTLGANLVEIYNTGMEQGAYNGNLAEAKGKIVANSSNAVIKAGYAMLDSGKSLEEVNDFLADTKIRSHIPAESEDDIVKALTFRDERLKSVRADKILSTQTDARQKTFNELLNGDTSSLDDPQKRANLSATDPDHLGVALQKINNNRDRAWFSNKYNYDFTPSGKEDKEFLASAQEVLALKSKDALSKWMINALAGDRKMSSDKLAVIGDMAAMLGQEQKLSDNHTDVAPSKQANELRASLSNLLASANPSDAPKNPANKGDKKSPVSPLLGLSLVGSLVGLSGYYLMANFGKNIKNKQSPTTAANLAVQSEVLRLRPQVASYPEEGKVLTDKNGNKLRFFPDGHTEEVK